jgi:hypothetical protein
MMMNRNPISRQAKPRILILTTGGIIFVVSTIMCLFRSSSTLTALNLSSSPLVITGGLVRVHSTNISSRRSSTIPTKLTLNATSTISETAATEHDENDVTIIVTSNLVPSHPSIRMINDTIHSLFKHAVGLSRDCPIIITIDNMIKRRSKHLYKPYEQDDYDRYDQYILNLQQQYQNAIIVPLAGKDQGLSWSVFHGMKHVKTRFVYLLQHDMPFLRSIQHTAMVQTMKDHPNDLRIVRFGRKPNIYTSSVQRIGGDGCWATPTPVDSINGLRFVKTPLWSDKYVNGTASASFLQ